MQHDDKHKGYPSHLTLDRLSEGWMDGWTDGWMGGWMDGWMHGWMDGRTDRWVGGWMDEYINGGAHACWCTVQCLQCTTVLQGVLSNSGCSSRQWTYLHGDSRIQHVVTDSALHVYLHGVLRGEAQEPGSPLLQLESIEGEWGKLATVVAHHTHHLQENRQAGMQAHVHVSEGVAGA